MGTARSEVESESNKCEGDGGVCDESREDAVAKGVVGGLGGIRGDSGKIGGK